MEVTEQEKQRMNEVYFALSTKQAHSWEVDGGKIYEFATLLRREGFYY